jgi:lipid A 3-O-deacylase
MNILEAHAFDKCDAHPRAVRPSLAARLHCSQSHLRALLLQFLLFLLFFSTGPALAQNLSIRWNPEADQKLLENPGWRTNWNYGFALGGASGVRGTGSQQSHDLTGASLHAGRFPNPDSISWLPCLSHFEFACEIWSATQYHPDGAYLLSVTPTLRYHFWPEARWNPFLDVCGGITATDIGGPDLSTTFQFNEQFGIGIHWRIRPDLAVTAVGRYIHLSNGGIDAPNSGVNSLLFGIGLTWFFPD